MLVYILKARQDTAIVRRGEGLIVDEADMCAVGPEMKVIKVCTYSRDIPENRVLSSRVVNLIK